MSDFFGYCTDCGIHKSECKCSPAAPPPQDIAPVLSLAEHKERLAREGAKRLYPEYNPYRLFDWYGFPKPGFDPDEDDYDDY